MYTLSSQYCYELTFDAKVGPVKNMSVYFYYTKIVRRQKMNAQAFSLHADALQILQRNGILLPELFWPTVKKIVLVIKKKFEIRGWRPRI